MATKKDEWETFIAGVKVGDKLISTPNWGTGVVVQVERVTATTLVCKPPGRDYEYKVRKADGRVAGEKGYRVTFFKPATPARLAEHRVARVKDWCRHSASSELMNLTPAQQETVYQLVTSFAKEEPEA